MENSRRNDNIRNMTFAALCTALCPVMPLLAGLIPNGRQFLSPMHIPPLLCGLVTGPVYGAAAGLLGPLLGALTVGTPPMAKLPQMMTELCCYGLVTGLMMKFVRTGKLRTDLWLSMVTAMVVGRIAGGLVTGLIMLKGEYSVKLWAGAYFAGTEPGIVIHLLLIPAIYYAIERSGLIPRRY